MTKDEIAVAREFAAYAASKYLAWIQTKAPREYSPEAAEVQILSVFSEDVTAAFFRHRGVEVTD